MRTQPSGKSDDVGKLTIVSSVVGMSVVENGSDHDLLKEALSDTGAVAVLYERYRDRIFACLIHTVMDRDLAEELTEAVFVKMVDNLPKLARQSAPGAMALPGGSQRGHVMVSPSPQCGTISRGSPCCRR